MKTLVVIRHGKSSWKHPNLKDHQRPLKQRGVNNAFSIGKELIERNINPDHFLSSPAVRALDTAIIIATNLGCSLEKIATDSTIYEASVSELLTVLSAIADEHETVLFFGHNPSFTSLVNRLQEEQLFNLPTCGAVGIELPITSWNQILETSGNQLFKLIPKEFS
ncbi:MAG: histidine phosphatase family protein [Flavobacteriales bacterium]|jgi:phosphohistidine phosphatase|nr:histidine phosphatase family protein [Flavobacteriales bacterium]